MPHQDLPPLGTEERLESLRSSARRDQRIGRFMAAGMAITTLVLGFLTANLVLHGVQPEPPFTYSREVYLPLGQVCPGEVLRWRSEFVVYEAPSTLRVVRTLYDVGQRQIITFDREPGWVNWMPEDVGVQNVFMGEYLVPKTLKIGSYELRTTAGSSASNVKGYRVPFEIKGKCFQTK